MKIKLLSDERDVCVGRLTRYSYVTIEITPSWYDPLIFFDNKLYGQRNLWKRTEFGTDIVRWSYIDFDHISVSAIANIKINHKLHKLAVKKNKAYLKDYKERCLEAAKEIFNNQIKNV